MNEEKIILDNVNLIHYVIKKMNLYWNTDDEWQQYYDDGMIGLINGAKTFDESKGIKVSSYLYHCISNAILQGIRRKINSKNNANNNAISLNTIITDEKECELYEIIPDEKVNIEEQTENKIKLEAINRVLEKIHDEDVLLFKMYYGLGGYEPKKQIEIAEELNIKQCNVSHKIRKITQMIKEKVSNSERKIIMGEEKTIFKAEATAEATKDPLQEVNIILLEQLQRLRNLDLEDTENSKLEIARSNAISSTSKTILQTIGIQLMVQKQQNNLLKIK